MCHIFKFLTRLSYREEEVIVVELGKKAGQQLMLTVHACVSTSGSSKPQDIFKETSGSFPAMLVATKKKKRIDERL